MRAGARPIHPLAAGGSAKTRLLAKRRWRFQPRGLIGLALAAVLLVNLYVLMDNIVCLIRTRAEEKALSEQLAEQRERNRALAEKRDWVQGDEFLREQAHSLGYVEQGELAEVTAEEVDPSVGRMVKDRPGGPSPAY